MGLSIFDEYITPIEIEPPPLPPPPPPPPKPKVEPENAVKKAKFS